jgi:hypothetical protein
MTKVSKKYVKFRPFIDPMNMRPYKPSDKGYFFRFNKGENKLIRFTMEDNGFREA